MVRVFIMINLTDITGLLLAGGKGSRFNGCDKGLIEFKNKKLAEHQIEWLVKQLNAIVISANRNLDFYEQFNYPVIADHNTNFDGPLTGILNAFKQCKTDWLFILPVDVPQLPSDLLQRMLVYINENKNKNKSENAYFLSSDQRKHYLIALMNKRVLPDLDNFYNNNFRRVRDFWQLINAKELNINIEEKYFLNINSLNDLHN